MTIEEALRHAVLASAPELAARLREEMARPRLLPLKAAPVAYRAILAAERSGELAVYRVGHASFVDEVELFDWIRRAGTKAAPAPEAAPADEIGELIALGDHRREGRKAAK